MSVLVRRGQGDLRDFLVLPAMFAIPIGFLQAIYLVPAAIYFRKKGKLETSKGILMGGLMTLALNALFWFKVMLGGGLF